MANYKTVFYGSKKSENTSKEIQCFPNLDGEIYLSITDLELPHGSNQTWVAIDVSTAIKLAKTLRYNINKSKETSELNDSKNI